MKTTRIPIVSVAALCCLYLLSCSGNGKPVRPDVILPGAIQTNGKYAPGYLLFAPQNNNTVYLIDKNGSVYNYWLCSNMGLNAYLLPSGNLLHTESINRSGGDPGGRIIMSGWNNEHIWSCTINSDTLQQSHDVYPLSDSVVLAMTWELIPDSEVVKARSISCKPDSAGMWSPKIVELHQSGDSAVITWYWRMWDHLLCDTCKPSMHPELMDPNYLGTPNGELDDWMHPNALAFNPRLNQIMFSSRNLNEIYIIDHSTSPTEVKGHKGGNCGKGGDFLYRWGNPAAYGMGAGNPQQLFGQHSPYWLDTSNVSNTCIMINNDGFLGAYDYSACAAPPSTQIATTFNTLKTPYNAATRAYDMAPGRACGPDAPVTTYTAPSQALWNEFEGNVQLLPDSNLMVCAAMQGVLYEMNPKNSQVVWQFNLNSNYGHIFRCYQYSSDYVEQAAKNGNK